MIFGRNKYKSDSNKSPRFFTIGIFFTIFLLVSFFVVKQPALALAADHAAQVSVSPKEGTFEEGSTFDVPIYVNTLKNSVNAVELRIKFSPDTLSVVRPSGGKSIIGLWVEPPSYDNTKGTVDIVGAIPGGIISDSGLIGTITFKAKAAGQAMVEVRNTSQVLLDDGAGTPTTLTYNRGLYTILPKPPGGVVVLSDTHPFQDRWYNNSNVTLAWNKDPSVTGFSYVLDNKPNTVPLNNITSVEPHTSYPDVSNGVSYFHIKPKRGDVWGAVTHFTIRVDKEAPRMFTPKIDYLTASVINRFLISFSTIDDLSGIDHYEIGTIDKSAEVTKSPVFVETPSPYQLPFDVAKNARVIVRAFDRAGNLREASLDVEAPWMPAKFIADNLTVILVIVLALIILAITLHYFYGHHIARRLKAAVALFKRDDIDPHVNTGQSPPNLLQ